MKPETNDMATCHNVKTFHPETGVETNTYTIVKNGKVYGTASRSATGRDFNFFPANGMPSIAVSTMSQIKAFVNLGKFDAYLVNDKATGFDGKPLDKSGTAGDAKVSGKDATGKDVKTGTNG